MSGGPEMISNQLPQTRKVSQSRESRLAETSRPLITLRMPQSLTVLRSKRIKDRNDRANFVEAFRTAVFFSRKNCLGWSPYRYWFNMVINLDQSFQFVVHPNNIDSRIDGEL
ncbi:hypothetical protein PROFUN_10046 [Planoprotostelium fungivorum]|uniref:Uncharacterized protein n=1 Tax=Planoprotostelium fungivorum TaxID=1890364 RepID=A0A2P6NFG6_9EUKA|nr:hypothetical protein PROFUN_10046 [Planoprotostelium fungivorum]